MFFLTYLGRELQHRRRQAVLVSLGLAIGVGLVITVTAVTAGVSLAQSQVVHALYGIGTDISVTKNPSAPKAGQPPPGAIQIGPGSTPSGGTVEILADPTLGTFPSSTVARLERLRGVSAAAGAFTLNDSTVTIPKNVGSGTPPSPQTLTLNGIDVDRLDLGPFSSGKVTSGRSFTSRDRNSEVAVVDANYATAHGLHVGSTLTITGQTFTVVGIIAQSQASSPPDVYIPLARAQALYAAKNSTAGDLINTVYLSTSSASRVTSVQNEIRSALPSLSVSSSSSLAGSVSGSLASTAALAGDLGRWLAVLVLIAAVAVASLLTLGAVGRRVREFGTLKALGWRSWRIIGQVLGESLVMGILGGAVGVGLGVGASTLITILAPGLSETITANLPGLPGAAQGGGNVAGSGGVFRRSLPGVTVPVHLTAPVSAEIVAVALLLAIGGALIAGVLASWRIARLRPANALARVE